VILTTKENWSLEISYVGFSYQNDLVSKLVSVPSVRLEPNLIHQGG